MKCVYVEWLDARGISGRTPSHLACREGLLPIKTCGLLIGQDEEVVRVAQDFWQYEDEDGTQPQIYREIEIIPRVLIQQIHTWEPGSPTDAA